MVEPLPPGFVRHQTKGRLLVVDRSLEDATVHLLEEQGFERLQRSATPGSEGRASTWIVALPESECRLLVRRVLHGGLTGPLRGALLLGLGRPLSELRVTAELRRRGAPVPRPAFVLGWRRTGPLSSAVVATVFEEETRDALSFLGAAPPPAGLLLGAQAAGVAVRRFHDAGGSHRDLHVKNLLLRERPDGMECIIVDLDGARLHATIPPGRRMAELMRLFRSLRKRGLLETLGPRGLARFFGSYVAGDRELRRALRAHLRKERVRVALHALRY